MQSQLLRRWMNKFYRIINWHLGWLLMFFIIFKLKKMAMVIIFWQKIRRMMARVWALIWVSVLLLRIRICLILKNRVLVLKLIWEIGFIIYKLRLILKDRVGLIYLGRVLLLQKKSKMPIKSLLKKISIPLLFSITRVPYLIL